MPSWQMIQTKLVALGSHCGPNKFESYRPYASRTKKRGLAKPLFCISPWLGMVNLFQTFEDLESVKDKEADIQAVRQVLYEETENDAGVQSC